MDENEDAGAVYMMTRRQVVTVADGRPIDVSIPAVAIAMDLFNVKNRLDCLRKVRWLWHEVQKKDAGE